MLLIEEWPAVGADRVEGGLAREKRKKSTRHLLRAKIYVPKLLHPHDPWSLGTIIPSITSRKFASRFPSLWFKLLCGKKQDQSQGLELALGSLFQFCVTEYSSPQAFGIQPSHTWCHRGAHARVCMPSPSSTSPAVPGTGREENVCWQCRQPELCLRQCFFFSRWY